MTLLHELNWANGGAAIRLAASSGLQLREAKA
jgi:hypothetical protein